MDKHAEEFVLNKDYLWDEICHLFKTAMNP